ncbi:2-amino-4-hydroxy-6-hydroxymethyldihydropteridine diphosphokinase [Amphibacillus sediminis]|uniref:2-amino-4-hydroxy-6- hydroxymethyldihydropteridine diphosphokinase n=1 Tax=Amphibacillus sediminis TaxID=360185 RepID=UPI00082FA439|nr:2-amino-4-hydroxy-6-hydroxymethyldihydropteridine diphosphokinase [Amphibacillus sediminis]
MNRAYIALGSNISPRSQYLEQAVQLLSECTNIEIINKSSIYHTEPMGYVDQNNFLNQVISIDTSLSSFDLLTVCQNIENDLGRKREIRWGPRTLDLDILLYNHENMITEQLILPHPRMHERAFVLVPLAELAPDLVIPGINETVREKLLYIPSEEKRGVVKWIKKDGVEE